MTPNAYEAVRKLAASDKLEVFDCGEAALNQFLQRYALANQRANSAQTYVSCIDRSVVGFYSLAVGSVEPEKAAPRVLKGMARHPVPVMILARLAVDLKHQGAGLGRALLSDALLRTAQPRAPACSLLPRVGPTRTTLLPPLRGVTFSASRWVAGLHSSVRVRGLMPGASFGSTVSGRSR